MAGTEFEAQSSRFESTQPPTSSTSQKMVSSARHRRRSPPTSNPPPQLSESKFPTIESRCMPEPPLSNSRKRRRLEPPQRNEISRPVLKKQRLSPPRGSQPPPAFWDKLSKIWLTKRALRELNRRHIQATTSPPRSPHRRARWPAPRFLAESKRKRQTGRSTTEYLRCCEPRILKDIKSFARHGGPDLSDLRNFYEPTHPSDHAMSSSRSSSRSRQQGSINPPSTDRTTNTTKTKSTGVYDRNFQQHLVDNSVYPDEYEYPDFSVPAEPNNYEDFRQIFALPRPSLSPSQFSDGEFRKLKRAAKHAAKEKQVSESVIPIIEGKIRDGRCRSGGIPFTSLDPLTDGTLKPGNPDVYYGARPEQLSPEVRDELSGQIIPSTQHDLPMAPNFFLAVKGPDGSAVVAERQACYDGALGARGMHSLRSYRKDEPVHDGNAYTITSTYHNGHLQMYTSHIAPPRNPGGRSEYHMTQLDSFALTGNRNTCVAGLQTYRNGRDWAEKQRNEAIMQANERVNSVEAVEAAGDAGASPALSFVTAASETEAYAMSQASRTHLDEDFHESVSSIEGPEDYRLPAKRGNRSSKYSNPQKRRNTDVAGGRAKEMEAL